VTNDLAALAAEAYIYGFPLIFDLQAASGHADMGLIEVFSVRVDPAFVT
jgi:hypothetical protein